MSSHDQIRLLLQRQTKSLLAILGGDNMMASLHQSALVAQAKQPTVVHDQDIHTMSFASSQINRQCQQVLDQGATSYFEKAGLMLDQGTDLFVQNVRKMLSQAKAAAFP